MYRVCIRPALTRAASSWRELEEPAEAIRRAIVNRPRSTDEKAVRTLIDEVLAPRCKFFVDMNDEIDRFDRTSKKALTDEQQRILEETELNSRQVFFGAAGTGKTFLAIEKCRRMARAGKKVLLTCFNKNLAVYMRTQIPPGVECLPLSVPSKAWKQTSYSSSA